MADVPRTTEREPLLEAFVELARSAIRNRAEASDRRAKITVVDGSKRGGRAA